MAKIKTERLIQLAKRSKLNKIAIIVKGEVIKFNLFNELRVNYDDINAELNNQPANYSYIYSIYSALIKDWKKKEAEKERIFGKQFKKVKDEFYAKHFKNTSDEYASSEAKNSIPYRLALKKELDAEERMNVFKGIVESFRQKANSLQQISANTRTENKLG